MLNNPNLYHIFLNNFAELLVLEIKELKFYHICIVYPEYNDEYSIKQMIKFQFCDDLTLGLLGSCDELGVGTACGCHPSQGTVCVIAYSYHDSYSESEFAPALDYISKIKTVLKFLIHNV